MAASGILETVLLTQLDVDLCGLGYEISGSSLN